MTDAADAGQGLKRESRFAIPAGFLATTLVGALLAALTSVDTSTLDGWWVPILSAAIGAGVAWLTAYKTKNTKAAPYA